MKNNLILLVFATLFLSSCNTVTNISKKTTTDSSHLVHNWVLLNDKEEETGVNNKPLSISFSGNNDHVISGFAGCNNFVSNYTASNGVIKVDKIASTFMSCPQLDAESQYLSLLAKVNRYSITGKNLYLYKDKLLLLHFVKN